MKAFQLTRTEALVAWKIVWAPVAVVAVHAILAAILGHRRAFDPAFHFLGGVAGAYSLSRGLLPPLGTAMRRQVAAVLVVCAVALLWELGEFMWEAVTGTRIQFGTRDTLTDLGLGAAGAALGAYLSVGKEVGKARA
jgi:hypothetical protein